MVRGANMPFRRLTSLYELPDGRAEPFRKMIAVRTLLVCVCLCRVGARVCVCVFVCLCV